MAINPISSGAFAPSSSPAALLSFFCSIVFRQPEIAFRYGTQFLFTVFIFKREKALAEVVERDENAHAAEHCAVFADGNGKARQQRRHKRLGNAVRHKIAQANIRRKARNDLPIALFITERVVFVEKIAQYAAEKVV